MRQMRREISTDRRQHIADAGSTQNGLRGTRAKPASVMYFRWCTLEDRERWQSLKECGWRVVAFKRAPFYGRGSLLLRKDEVW